MGKVNIKSKIGNLLEWEGGQRLFNFAYSIGAAIVIWGALFEILHLQGGRTLLCIGLGTEILMFVISAFDRPPKENNYGGGYAGPVSGGESVAEIVPAQRVTGVDMADTQSIAESIQKISMAAEQLSNMAQLTTVTQDYLNQMSALAAQMEQFSASISEFSRGYADRMNDLNRNLGGLNTIYEVQLKSVSSQLDSIERVNRGLKDIRDMYEKSAAQSARYCEETEKMARYMQQLNRMYEKTLDTMTVNIARPVTADMQ